jgi:hypothetical protein
MKTIIAAALFTLVSATAGAATLGAGANNGLDSPLYNPSWPQVTQTSDATMINSGDSLSNPIYHPNWPQANSNDQGNFISTASVGLNSPLYHPSWPQVS